MKTGDYIRYVNPDNAKGESQGSVDWVTIHKDGKAVYTVAVERNSRLHTKKIESSTEVRKIVKALEKMGYRKQGGASVELDA